MNFAYSVTMFVLPGKQIRLDVWELSGIFALLALRLDPPQAPELVVVANDTLTLGLDFQNLDASTNKLAHENILPNDTNLGVAARQGTLTHIRNALVFQQLIDLSFAVDRQTLNLNSQEILLHSDGTISLSGAFKIVRKVGCFCKIKVRVFYTASVRPEIVDKSTGEFKFLQLNPDVRVNVQVRFSGLLNVMDWLFLGLLSSLVSLIVNGIVQKKINTALDSGFEIDLSNIRIDSSSPPLNLTRPEAFGDQPPLQLEFTRTSITVEDDDIRVAVQINS